MVTRQLQVERRTGEVRQRETDVLPLSHAANLATKKHTSACSCQIFFAIGRKVVELLQVFDFQYGGRPPSWILCTHARDYHRSGIVALYHYAKFGQNPLSSFDNWSY